MVDNLFTGSAFNKSLTEGKLMGTRCKTCGALYLPPRPFCPHCLKSDVEWVEFGGQGKLLTYSFIYTVTTAICAEGYSRTNPFCAGIVQLAEGPAISAQILGIDAAHPEPFAVGKPASVEYISSGEGETRKTRLAFRISQ